MSESTEAYVFGVVTGVLAGMLLALLLVGGVLR